MPAINALKPQVLKFEAVSQLRLYEQIAKQISNMIRDLPIPPGTKLPPERDLAKQFQVSRTTVREAILVLETLRLIEVCTGDGTYVRAWPSTSLRLPWATSGDPGPGPHEQYRVRSVIECAAAEDAAEFISEEEIDELKRLMAEMERDIDGPDAEKYRRAFHFVIAKASRNSIFAEMIDELWKLREGELWLTVKGRVVRAEHHVETFEDRRKIVAALATHDRRAARLAMSDLIERIRIRYFE